MNDCNYGFIFNDINIIDNRFVKKAKNILGLFKINNEINFYLYISNNNINFSTPKLVDHKNGEIILEFIKNAYILTNIINENNFNELLNKIINQLTSLHRIKIDISQQDLQRDLQIEVKNKVLNRYNEYDWNSNNDFKSIKSVNSIIIKDVYYYCQVIYNKLSDYLFDRKYYNLIHGDIHLGNILIDEKNNMYFIDPRGYFGESKLFGLFEYDYAKLFFGLSGYSQFDNMKIETLDISNNNIEIYFIKNYEKVFESSEFDNITKLLSLSIWLGNNSCFIDNNKKIISLMTAYYYCEKYIDKL
jgi:hypothetical protein